MDQSLIKWINSFDNLSEKCDNIEDLTDGIILYDICKEISPKHFDTTLVSRQDAKDNWVLRSENVKNLLSSLDSWFSSELGLTEQTVAIDADTVAKDMDPQETIKLVELILGVVVECENKGEYIGRMQSLDPKVQGDLMLIIEKIMTSHQELMSTADHSRTSFDGEDQSEDSIDRQNHHSPIDDSGVKERLAQFETQIDGLQRDKSNLQNELEEMTLTCNQLQRDQKGWDQEKENLLEVCSNLQQSLESAQKRLDEQKQQASLNVMSDIRIKDEINTLQQQIDDKEKQIQELKRKVRRLSFIYLNYFNKLLILFLYAFQIDEGNKQINENRELRDEIDILREKVTNAELAEEKLKKYQQKIEEIAELKKQTKTLEENNDNYLNQILDLEEQVKKSNTFKTQLESSKQQVLTLKIDNTKLEMSLKSISEDRDRLQSTISQMELDHQSLTGQLDSQTIKLQQLEHDSESKLLESSQSSSFVGGLDQVLDSSTKERLARLERENKRLKESVERLEELESQLEEANSYKEIMMKEMATLQQQQQQTSPSQSSPSEQQMQQQQQQLQQQIQQQQQQSVVIQELNGKILEMNNKNLQLQSEIEKMKQSVESVNTTLSSKNQQLEDATKQIDDLRKQQLDLLSKQQVESTTADSEDKGKVAEYRSEIEKLEGYLRAARKMIKAHREKEKEFEAKEAKITAQEEYIANVEKKLKQKDERVDSLAKQIKEGKEAQQRELNLMLTAFLNIGVEFERLKNSDIMSKDPRSYLNKKRTDWNN
ncbi:hook family protein [Heterostelium album PN500]|uniref:Hook family protein n=1 Tax=Heterostelium pallidum (strain ATCC 26659 / Pp 5 / PN500) TaxID=670386 RepID=D3B8W2_HETP5|nr:hook family protein [Heterostelium album PN500]EFA82480.1 hook family protein [Heterostelium album PN500]|eukprot:XP_020434597.1 hook family protein [Heterostelium album PN500]